MELKHPYAAIFFVPTPAYMLAPFDIYDREDTLGAQLDSYNPNDIEHLRVLLDLYFFHGWTDPHGYNVYHRRALVECMASSLTDPGYNFSALLGDDAGYFTLPSSWKIAEPRVFFLNCYRELLVRWQPELEGTGYVPPLPGTLES